MKCKHIHKDSPDNFICEDCMKEQMIRPIVVYDEVKGGIKNENN